MSIAHVQSRVVARSRGDAVAVAYITHEVPSVAPVRVTINVSVRGWESPSSTLTSSIDRAASVWSACAAVDFPVSARVDAAVRAHYNNFIPMMAGKLRRWMASPTKAPSKRLGLLGVRYLLSSVSAKIAGIYWTGKAF